MTFVCHRWTIICNIYYHRFSSTGRIADNQITLKSFRLLIIEKFPYLCPDERGCTLMIVVNVKENESIEKALKRFKKKFDKTGTVRELRARQAFTKPSVKRRDQVIKAAYRQRLQNEANT